MDKINEINSVEKELLKVPKSDFLKELVERYRSRLLEKYKTMIFENYEADLTEELMREAVIIMDASEEEIIKMFFEDAQNKYADMEDEEYFNQLFEAATQ